MLTPGFINLVNIIMFVTKLLLRIIQQLLNNNSNSIIIIIINNNSNFNNEQLCFKRLATNSNSAEQLLPQGRDSLKNMTGGVQKSKDNYHFWKLCIFKLHRQLHDVAKIRMKSVTDHQ